MVDITDHKTARNIGIGVAIIGLAATAWWMKKKGINPVDYGKKVGQGLKNAYKNTVRAGKDAVQSMKEASAALRKEMEQKEHVATAASKGAAAGAKKAAKAAEKHGEK